MINFISNLPHDLRSGGFSGINAAAFDALASADLVNYVGPIDPPARLAQKVRSKLLRMSGIGGDFFFFSEERLRTIANEVASKRTGEARLDAFHGFTPWVLTAPTRPYMAWSDCTFRDYIDVYHRRASFRATDLARIEHAESVWLKRARRVLFTSAWAANRAITQYDLEPDRVGVIGIFGEADPPTEDVYAGDSAFAFISTNFEAKGGRTVLEALGLVRKRHPGASLVVVGSHPDGAAPEGVLYTGFLRKEVAAEREKFRDILGRARAIVHPTRSDIAPLLLVEAGYFGCPVITSRRFAIPELVDDRRTGLLLDNPGDPGAVAAAMTRMLEAEGPYRAMRSAAWQKARAQHSRKQFEQKLLSAMRDVKAAE